MTLADVRTVLDTAATTFTAVANAPDLNTTPASEGSVPAVSKPAPKRARPAAEPPSAGTVKDPLLGERMIRIPAGPFRRNGMRTVTLPLFWIAKFPVTNERYALFVSMTRRQPPAAGTELSRRQSCSTTRSSTSAGRPRTPTAPG